MNAVTHYRLIKIKYQKPYIRFTMKGRWFWYVYFGLVQGKGIIIGVKGEQKEG